MALKDFIRNHMNKKINNKDIPLKDYKKGIG